MPKEAVSHTFRWLIVIFAAAAVGLLIATYYVVQKDIELAEMQEWISGKIHRKTTTPVEVPSDWKTYTNSTYGFSFKYPGDWIVREIKDWPNTLLALGVDAKNNQPKNDTDQPNLIRIEVYNSITKLDNKKLGATSLKDYLDKYAALSDPVYEKIKPAKVGNEDGYTAEAGPNQFGGGINYFIEVGEKIYRIWIFDSSSSYSKSTVVKFLSTFQFTK